MPSVVDQKRLEDIEAEKALLGLLIVRSSTLEEISGVLRPDDFYEKGHQVIYQALIDFSQKESGHTLDLTSFSTFLRNEKLLGPCGGISYLTEIAGQDSVGLSANASFYAKTIKEYSRRRKAQVFAAELNEKCKDFSQPVQEIIDQGEQQLSALSTEGSLMGDYLDINNVMNKAVSVVMDKGASNTGVYSGFNRLDDNTGGFRKQELTIIGARPSVGKTAFALSMALNMIMKGVKVGFFSLEMSATSLGCRLLSAHSGVDFSHIRKTTLTKDEVNRIFSAVDDIYTKKLFIQDTPNMKLMELRAQARRMKMKEDVDILFIDYIGLIEYENQTMERFNQVSQISRSLKQLSRELDIPIVCLCQVGRQAEGNEPKLSDLRDSGSIEQDADLVILLHRARDWDKEKKMAPGTIQPAKIILAKNRNGETGDIEIGFKANIVRFVELEQGKSYIAGNSANA